MEPLVAALQAGRPARTAIPAGAGGGGAAAATADLQAGAVCLQCRGSRGRDRQCVLRRVVGARRAAEGARAVIVSAAIEAEVAQLPEADRGEFLEGLGLHDSGLDRVIRAGYDLLGLITYFTVGPKETRAWTIVRGTKAPQAAAVIHGISSAASSPARPSPTTTSSPCKGEPGAQGGRQDARRGQGLRRARTATCCCSASTSEGEGPSPRRSPS